MPLPHWTREGGVDYAWKSSGRLGGGELVRLGWMDAGAGDVCVCVCVWTEADRWMTSQPRGGGGNRRGAEVGVSMRS